MKDDLAAAFARTSALATVTLLTSLSLVHADTLGRLQGYWAAKSLQCSDVFTKTGTETHFVKLEGYRRQGLIIKKNSVEAQNGSCEIISHKELANSLAIGMTCKMEIMFDTLVAHIRLDNNDNELVQFDPDLPDLTTTYKRCPM